MNLKSLLILPLFLLSLHAYADEGHAVRMATENSFHADEISIPADSSVLVFGKINNTYALEENTLSISYFEDPITGDENGVKTGKEVALKQKIENFSPEIIFQADFLQKGPVKSAKITPNCLENHNDTSCEIDFDGQIYKVTVDSTEIADSDTVEEKYNYNLTIAHENSSTKLSSDRYRINSLYWAGDLDRDGKLDLITDGTAHYNVGVGFTLYLSSFAKDGELMGFAGAVFGYGC